MRGRGRTSRWEPSQADIEVIRQRLLTGVPAVTLAADYGVAPATVLRHFRPMIIRGRGRPRWEPSQEQIEIIRDRLLKGATAIRIAADFKVCEKTLSTYFRQTIEAARAARKAA